ncbi:uncharacterized protein LOC104873663 [Fukomys damarensis]|uniref:uncharacterized protein LOC104873663 n=1 Tax=Fukomys damarensis TaxID=885580 RepID=UPI00053FB596|nr:uncharacterized protein LOC104873663 [Fukomys damarensis]
MTPHPSRVQWRDMVEPILPQLCLCILLQVAEAPGWSELPLGLILQSVNAGPAQLPHLSYREKPDRARACFLLLFPTDVCCSLVSPGDSALARLIALCHTHLHAWTRKHTQGVTALTVTQPLRCTDGPPTHVRRSREVPTESAQGTHRSQERLEFYGCGYERLSPRSASPRKVDGCARPEEPLREGPGRPQSAFSLSHVSFIFGLGLGLLVSCSG